MFQRDRIQWLQNYRRKRWTQIRNICYAFIIEANTSVEIDMNVAQNACTASKGCKYTHKKTKKTWTSEYDAEYSAYKTDIIASDLGKMSIQKKSKK